MFIYSVTDMPYEMHEFQEMPWGSALPRAKAAAAVVAQFKHALYFMHSRHMSGVYRLLLPSHDPGTGWVLYPEVQQHTSFAGMNLWRHQESPLESLLKVGTRNVRLSALIDASATNTMWRSLWRVNTIRRRYSRSSMNVQVCERRSSTLSCRYYDTFSDRAWHSAIYPESEGLIKGYQSRDAAVSGRRVASGESGRTISMRFKKAQMNTSRGSSQRVFDLWPASAPAMLVHGPRPGRTDPIRDYQKAPKHPGLQNNAMLALRLGRSALPILLDARPGKAPAYGHVPRGDHR
ncbi:hypothetical protein AWB81_04968 [Caballeronia arationis]|jgi:hypothetical protein|uniref:Uncharacterized protein n=1 Tax=Caballeronia arationis TaxID=1777142 RepID=A0A7Z7I3F2_9BURK|nr:hypothetical protein AWB81_04968 [Caballeronia arationis]SOE55228.1 hypothetical protein SAMN05446927_0979 [Caballeronia arationis]